MRILVDGDGCPVKEEVCRLSLEYDLPVVIVTTYDHFSNKLAAGPKVRFHYVESGQDAVDFYLHHLLEEGDVIITQDYGLASLLIGSYRVFHHTGQEYTIYNMGLLLNQRFLGQKGRKAGHHQKGPSKFTAKDRALFMKRMRQMIEEG